MKDSMFQDNTILFKAAWSLVYLQSPKVTRTWNVSLSKMNRSLWLIICIAVSYPCWLHGSKCNRFCLAVLIPIEVKVQIRSFKFGSNLPTAKFIRLVDVLSPLEKNFLTMM